MKANILVSSKFCYNGIQVNVASLGPTDKPALRKLKGKSATV